MAYFCRALRSYGSSGSRQLKRPSTDTFKSTVFTFIWLLASPRQRDEYCNDFLWYYNRDRPHSAYGGRTPDEVYFGRKPQMTPLGEATYFDGHLRWFRFG